MTKHNLLTGKQLVGIIPAAGKGTRVAPLPGSKELFPIGFGEVEIEGKKRHYPKVISQYLVDQMVTAGVKQIYMIISEGKWDILKYYGNGKHFGAQIAYLMVDELHGMPYTINTAFPYLENSTVLFGMPDTIFRPVDALRLLLAQHELYGADLTLGLFGTDQPQRFGMVEFDDEHHLITCIDKPNQTHLNFMWGNACWGPAFSKLLNDELQITLSGESMKSEIVLGDYFIKAVKMGLNVCVHPFIKGEYVDIGSPKDLKRAVIRFVESEMEHSDEIIF